jgi:hypothetical protein
MTPMAKGQKRTNRETRKPKQATPTKVVALGAVIRAGGPVRATFASPTADKKKPNE